MYVYSQQNACPAKCKANISVATKIYRDCVPCAGG